MHVWSAPRRLAKELGLEISASLEDTRQVVSGKITEVGRHPQNVQVDLVECGRGVVITLRDDEGAFLMSQPVDREDEGDGQGDDAVSMRNAVGVGGGVSRTRTPSGSGSEREAELEAELSRLADENTGLNLEVRELKVGSGRREGKVQLAEYDSIVAEKDREIAALRVRMAELEPVGHGSSLSI